MKLSLGVALLVATVLAASACGSGNANPRASTVNVKGPTVTWSRFIDGGAVRCTATMTTPMPVPVGQPLVIAIRLHNRSTDWAKASSSMAGPRSWVVVKNRDGRGYDSRDFRVYGDSGATGPRMIAAGATVTERLALRVRWGGPLQITPGCSTAAMRTLPVDVTSPGPPTSGEQAISEVVAAAGHFLDHCRPRTPGVAVVGRIDPPRGNAPPLHARCSVTLRHERGFDIAQVLVVTPPGLRGTRVTQHPGEAVSIPSGPAITRGQYWLGYARNAEAIAWEFVVTRRGARSFDSATVLHTRPGGGALPAGIWSSAGWQPVGAGGQVTCGVGTGSTNGQTGPRVTFITVCR
jgi:hypothetical protein